MTIMEKAEHARAASGKRISEGGRNDELLCQSVIFASVPKG